MDWWTPVGVAALVVAIATGLVQYFRDQPAARLLRERIDDLEKARTADRIKMADTTADLAKAQAEATAAKELATNRAKVDELFAYIKSIMDESRPRTERFSEILETTLEGLKQHDNLARERHMQEMKVLDGVARVMERMARELDIRTNGGHA
jgi:hypothetical protein